MNDAALHHKNISLNPAPRPKFENMVKQTAVNTVLLEQDLDEIITSYLGKIPQNESIGEDAGNIIYDIELNGSTIWSANWWATSLRWTLITFRTTASF